MEKWGSQNPLSIMIQLNRTYNTKYVEQLHLFLNKPINNFYLGLGIFEPEQENRRNYITCSPELIKILELEFNQKSKIAEESKTIKERIDLSLSYQRCSDYNSSVSVSSNHKKLHSMSRNYSELSKLDLNLLSDFLNVSKEWLETGESRYLSPKSLIGRRVGEEMLMNRMILRSRIMLIFDDLFDDNKNIEHYNSEVNFIILESQELSNISRKAGGIWQIQKSESSDQLDFVFNSWDNYFNKIELSVDEHETIFDKMSIINSYN